MNRMLGGIAGLLIATFFVVTNMAAQATTFKGEITDEKLNCTQTPVKATEGVTDKVACILYWAHSASPASKYVLYDAATKTTYQLDDQTAVQPYIGGKVEVTGTLDAATKSIKVTGIKTDESAYKKAS